MKVIKKLDDYISVKVSDKIQISDSNAEAQKIRYILDSISEEFLEKVKQLKQSFFEDCEKRYPELKQLTRDTTCSSEMYKFYNTIFTQAISEREKHLYALRKIVHDRIVLQIELSEESLNLDDIDNIIYREICSGLDSIKPTETINENSDNTDNERKTQ